MVQGIPFQSVYTIITSLTCFSTRYMKPIMLEFYHILALRWAPSLQFDQSSHALDYLPHFFPLHFEHDLDYHIFQL